VVVVADTNGLAVKLGIKAPKHVQVHRHEVYERIGATLSQKAECYPS
jgi:carbon storage regulator CsrA